MPPPSGKLSLALCDGWWAKPICNHAVLWDGLLCADCQRGLDEYRAAMNEGWHHHDEPPVRVPDEQEQT